MDSMLLTIQLPDDSMVKIEDILGGPLPGNWPFAEAQTQYFGSEWLDSGASIALEVHLS